MQCFCSFSHDDWISLLPCAEFAYNNLVHDATNQSPFWANYGSHPSFLPITIPKASVQNRITFIQTTKYSGSPCKRLNKTARSNMTSGEGEILSLKSEIRFGSLLLISNFLVLPVNLGQNSLVHLKLRGRLTQWHSNWHYQTRVRITQCSTSLCLNQLYPTHFLVGKNNHHLQSW